MTSDRSSRNGPSPYYWSGRGGRRFVAPFDGEEIALGKSLSAIQEVHDYWQSKRDTSGFPRKQLIQPYELKSYLGRISIVSVQRDPDDFVYRLLGSDISDLVMQELSGKSVLAVRPESYARFVFDQFLEARNRAEPIVHLINMWVDSEKQLYQRICLPLSEDGGSSVDYIMTYAVDVSWDGWAFKELYLDNEDGSAD